MNELRQVRCECCGESFYAEHYSDVDVCGKCKTFPRSAEMFKTQHLQDQENIRRSKIIKQKEGSITMDDSPSMTGTAKREPKNVAIENQLNLVRQRARLLHRKLDELIDEYRGNPQNEIAKESGAPDAPYRSMMDLTDALPKDLVDLITEIDNAIEKLANFKQLIL